MRILSNALVRKLFAYTVFALILLVMAFFTYRHEEESNEHLPFKNELLYQLNPAYTGPYSIT